MFKALYGEANLSSTKRPKGGWVKDFALFFCVMYGIVCYLYFVSPRQGIYSSHVLFPKSCRLVDFSNHFKALVFSSVCISKRHHFIYSTGKDDVDVLFVLQLNELNALPIKHPSYEEPLCENPDRR